SAAAAADHHDVLCLHSRRGAPHDFRRSRCGDAPHAGYRSVRRHARRDALWHLLDAGLLLRHPVGQRLAGGSNDITRRPVGVFHLTPLMESDLRPGGPWLMRGLGMGGKPFIVRGEYRAIERPRLVEFTWLPIAVFMSARSMICGLDNRECL